MRSQEDEEIILQNFVARLPRSNASVPHGLSCFRWGRDMEAQGGLHGLSPKCSELSEARDLFTPDSNSI